MIAAPEKCKGEIVLYIILVAIYLAVFFTLMFANSHTESSVKRQAQDTFFIKNQSSKLKLLASRATDAELARLIETMADNMHASPSRSNPNAAMVESNISMKVMEIEMAVNEGRADDAKRSCRELGYLIEERNRVLTISY